MCFACNDGGEDGGEVAYLPLDVEERRSCQVDLTPGRELDVMDVDVLARLARLDAAGRRAPANGRCAVGQAATSPNAEGWRAVRALRGVWARRPKLTSSSPAYPSFSLAILTAKHCARNSYNV